MKKILTAATACILMCACSPSPKADNAHSAADTDQPQAEQKRTDAADSPTATDAATRSSKYAPTPIDSADIIGKTHQFLREMNDANEAGDEAKQTSVSQAYQLWYMTLNDEEQRLSQEIAYQESVGKY